MMIFLSRRKTSIVVVLQASIFIDQLPQAQQFIAGAQSVFKVHWGFSFPSHKSNLYLCEYRWCFLPLLTKEARASTRCLLPAGTQALKGQLGWGWKFEWRRPGGGVAGVPMGSMGCPVASLPSLLPAGFNCMALLSKSWLYRKKCLCFGVSVLHHLV